MSSEPTIPPAAPASPGKPLLPFLGHRLGPVLETTQARAARLARVVLDWFRAIAEVIGDAWAEQAAKPRLAGLLGRIRAEGRRIAATPVWGRLRQHTQQAMAFIEEWVELRRGAVKGALPGLRQVAPLPKEWNLPRNRLALSIRLEESGPGNLVRTAILTIGAMMFAFIIWASLTRITEVAVASGEVIPAGATQVIQHLEGGIVSEILVQAGDLVVKDQVIARLSSAQPSGELDRLIARKVGLKLEFERHNAFAERRPPVFVVPEERFADLVKVQERLLETQNAQLGSQNVVLDQQTEQRMAEIAVLQETESSLRQQVTQVQEQYKIRTELLSKGLSSKVQALEVQKELIRVKGQLNEVSSQIRRARGSLGESVGRVEETFFRMRTESLERAGQVSQEVAQIDEQIAQMADRIKRLEVRSPVRGQVQKLEIHTVGGVLAPGAPLAEIVPLDDELVVKGRINTKDIGSIAVGMKAKVKFTAFDFTRYGGIEATLVNVSPTTFTDDKGNSYYQGLFHLAKNHLGNVPGRNLVLPGMSTVVDINTGEKTLTQYLLKPVFTAVDQAFRER